MMKNQTLEIKKVEPILKTNQIILPETEMIQRLVAQNKSTEPFLKTEFISWASVGTDSKHNVYQLDLVEKKEVL